VRGRGHTDKVLVGKVDTRHEADLGMNGEYTVRQLYNETEATE